MDNNKVFILLPDGIGLRNFAFTNFPDLAAEKGFDITYWNNTPFDLTEMGYPECKIAASKPHILTDFFKRARKQIELNANVKRSGDPVYAKYRFAFSYRNLKVSAKSHGVNLLTKMFDSKRGLRYVRKIIKTLERSTPYYKQSIETLKKEKPAIVFCTNQRPLLAIAPMVAAQDLGIPTAAFIFSWDNLPKATMIIEADYYFVWSDHMKKELLYYYPYIQEHQVFVTGTPQFESHFDTSLLISKDAFFSEYGLDSDTKYICYSGDDVTTSPNDPQYLSGTADAVRKLNQKGHKLGIVFRRCPVDFSNRFDAVLEKNKDIIIPIAPKWERLGEKWNTVLPTKADLILQMNTIANTEFVINLGSSMVFDFVTFGKPCMYLNYDTDHCPIPTWSVKKIYNYIHFRSMPDKNAVIWINSPDEFESKIEALLHNKNLTLQQAETWFEKINRHPVNKASERVLESIKTIISK